MIWSGLDKRTQRAVEASCRRLGIQNRGTHGFRGTFAQGRYREYRDQGLTVEQAAEKLTRDMGHGRVDVLGSYVLRSYIESDSPAIRTRRSMPRVWARLRDETDSGLQSRIAGS